MVNDSSFKNVVNKIFLSKRMKKYLVENCETLSEYQKASIIGGSLLDIEEKKGWAFATSLIELEKTCIDAIKNMTLNNDEIFYLREYSRNDIYEMIRDDKFAELGRQKYDRISKRTLKECADAIEDLTVCLNSPIKNSIKPFYEYKNILKYIDLKCRDEIQSIHGLREDYDNYYYYVVEKWKRIDPEKINYKKNVFDFGDMELVCKFYIVNQKTVFYEEFENGRKKHSNKNLLCDSANLNIPIPFKSGEILNIDMRPFMDNKNVFLLTKGDNKDCCSVQVLYIDEKDQLRKGALKHSHISYYHDFVNTVSPLYRITDKALKLYGKEKIFIDMKKDIIKNFSNNEEYNFIDKWENKFLPYIKTFKIYALKSEENEKYEIFGFDIYDNKKPYSFCGFQEVKNDDFKTFFKKPCLMIDESFVSFPKYTEKYLKELGFEYIGTFDISSSHDKFEYDYKIGKAKDYEKWRRENKIN